MARDAVGGVHVAQRHTVFQPEFQRIPPHLPGDVVHHALAGKIALRDAVAPHGAGRAQIGVHRPCLGAVGQDIGIGLAEAGDGIGHDGMAVGGVAPLIGDRPALPGHKAHIRPHGGLQVEVDGMAGAGILKGLLPGALQFHRPAAHLGGDPGIERFVEYLLFIPEPAADIGLDDPYVAPADAQGLADDAADDMGDLGGGHHHDAPGFHIGVRHRVLDVAVLNGLGVEVVLEDPVGGIGKDLIHILYRRARGDHVEQSVLQDIVRVLLVDGKGPLRHRLFRRGANGVLLILHPDGLQPPLRCQLIFRYHYGDVVPIDAYPGGQQLSVGHVLVCLLHTPGMARRGILDVGHIKTGEHLHHAGDRLGF